MLTKHRGTTMETKAKTTENIYCIIGLDGVYRYPAINAIQAWCAYVTNNKYGIHHKEYIGADASQARKNLLKEGAKS